MDRVNLLVCDLDGTLLGDDLALAEFADWYAEAKSQFRLIYSSGRFTDSVRQSIDSTLLPEPDALIGGVGTEIYDAALGRRLAMWPPTILGWNPHVVRSVCQSFRELALQPDQFLSYHKISYFGANLDQSFIAHLSNELTAYGVATTLIYSSNRDLDVLPADAHKGAAAAFLARTWKIDPRRVIVAGDSGNDAAMFHVGFRGVVVGNAQPELRALVAPDVYHARGEYAAGVMEGVRHWLEQWPQPAAIPLPPAAKIDRWPAAPGAGRGTRG